jgi:hypothetical protein
MSVPRRTWANAACAAACAALFAFACDTDVFEPAVEPSGLAAHAGSDARVVVVVIDGPRYDHLFGDPTHQHVPRMWGELRPLGTLFTHFRNQTWTLTVSGHASIATGVWQQLDNEGLERPAHPTIFEYYRATTGAPATDAVLVGGKQKLDACSYSTHASYGASFGASVDVDFPSDLDTHARLIDILQNDHPRLVVASFSQVDQKAHTGVFADYTRQIEIVDSLVADTWQVIEADTFYAGRTYMFVTADHGRHDDAHGGFQNHGDNCDGCTHLISLVLGPDIRRNYTVTNLYTQRDVCTTVGHLLGVPTPMAQGYLMGEMFEPVVSGILE